MGTRALAPTYKRRLKGHGEMGFIALDGMLQQREQ